METERKEKVSETPGYCKAEDLVNLFGLPIQSISQLTRDGVLRKEDTLTGKRYNVVRATRAVIQHLLDRANEEKGTLESKKLEMLNAEARIAKAKAEIAEREAEEAQGWPF